MVSGEEGERERVKKASVEREFQAEGRASTRSQRQACTQTVYEQEDP